jgi:hypothetical protein
LSKFWGPLHDFSGGAEANGFVEKLEFRVVELREFKPAESSVHDLLEKILSEFLGARTEGAFGRSHPIWQNFIALKEAIEALPVFESRPNLRVEWSAGKGNWASVPWVAIIDRRESDAPIRGIYCAYLFRADMTGVYAVLTQGVTKLWEEHGAIDARTMLKDEAVRIRAVVPDLPNFGFLLDNDIDLRGSGRSELNHDGQGFPLS